jgi:hypothetical protein
MVLVRRMLLGGISFILARGLLGLSLPLALHRVLTA